MMLPDLCYVALWVLELGDNADTLATIIPVNSKLSFISDLKFVPYVRMHQTVVC